MKVIGLWNSGSPLAKTEISKGLARLDALGIAAAYPKLSARYASRPESKTRAFLAGPDHAKLEALEELAGSREIEDILAMRGGYGGIRLLPSFDKSRILRNYDKVLWGYSDLTVIQHYFFEKCGAAWVHAPMLGSASFHSPNALEARWWRSSLATKSSVDTHILRAVAADLSIKRTMLSGPLMGGNLACLVSMMGTPWEPRFPTSTLLFIEDIKEPAYKMDRLLHQLSGHRDIKNISAVLVGHLTECTEGMNIIKLWSQNLGIPTYKGLRAGHQAPHLPLPMGIRVNLERRSATEARLVVPSVTLG